MLGLQIQGKTYTYLEFCPAKTLPRPEPCPWQCSNRGRVPTRAEFQPGQSSNRDRVPVEAEFQPGKVPVGAEFSSGRSSGQGRVPTGWYAWLIFLVRWSLSCFTYMVVWNLVHGPWTLEASMKAYSPWSSTWGYFVRHIIMIPQEVPLWNWNLNAVPYFSRLCLGGLRRCLHDCLYEYS